jgi:hypothetical protein
MIFATATADDISAPTSGRDHQRPATPDGVEQRTSGEGGRTRGIRTSPPQEALTGSRVFRRLPLPGRYPDLVRARGGTPRDRGRRLLAAVAVLALGASCGEGETSDAQRLVRAAALDLTATTIDATYSMTFDFAGETFTMAGDMAMDLQASVGRMTIRMHGVPDVPADAQLRVVIDGDDTYFHDPELYETSDWIRVSSDEAGIGDRVGTGPDLSAFLGYLNGARDVETIGAENVAGVSTTRYEGDIDLEKAVAQTHTQAANDAGEATEQLRGQLGEMDVSFDVWIDDAGTIRRMALAFDPREGDGGFRVRVNVREVGAELNVQVPSEDEIVDLQDLEPPA